MDLVIIIILARVILPVILDLYVIAIVSVTRTLAGVMICVMGRMFRHQNQVNVLVILDVTSIVHVHVILHATF